jgi:Ca2+-binding RTX toxin-like protein
VLTSEQLTELQALKDAGDPVAYYTFLKSAGVGYATLALGVASDANSNSMIADFGGLYAQNYLKEKYRQFNGVDLPEHVMQQVKVNLMQADYAVRSGNGGTASGDAIATYHYEVFDGLGIPRSAWTGDTLHRRISDLAWCLTCGPEEIGPSAQNPLSRIVQGIHEFTAKFSAEEWAVFTSDALFGKVLAKTLFEYGAAHPSDAAIASVITGVAVGLMPTISASAFGALALSYLAPDSWNTGLAIGALLTIDPSLSIESAKRLVDGSANSYSLGAETLACLNAIQAQLPAYCAAEFGSNDFAGRVLDFIKSLGDSGARGVITSALTTTANLAELAQSNASVRAMLVTGAPFSITWLSESSPVAAPAYGDFPPNFWSDREKWLRGIAADNLSETIFPTGDTWYIDQLTGVAAKVGDGLFADRNVIFNGDGYQGSSDTDIVYGGVLGDTLLGGAGNDKAWGGRGRDRLDGGAGADSLYGGQDDDTYIVDNPHDETIEEADEGYDTVEIEGGALQEGAYQLQQNVEKGVLLDSAGAAVLTGNSRVNSLVGNAHGNILVASGEGDTLEGQGGNDLYELAEHALVFEAEGGGTDTVLARFSGYRLDANVENLVVAAIVAGGRAIGYGNSSDNLIQVADETKDTAVQLIGYAGNDILRGGEADDYLSGGADNDKLYGGMGDDVLYGGLGADDIYGEDGTDTLGAFGSIGSFLSGGGGDDSLFESGSYNTLQGDSGFDYLSTQGSAAYAYGGDDSDSLVDSGTGNRLFGDAGNDSVELYGTNSYGYGGAGNDYLVSFGYENTLDGGSGNDYYVSGDAALRVMLGAGSGHDTLDMSGATAGVVRLVGVQSGSVSAAVVGTSLVLSVGSSSLTILNYLVDGNLSSSMEGVEFDDGMMNNEDLLNLADYDPNVIRGTAGSDALYGDGVASRIIGMASDDYLFGSGATETFEWSQGDGLDTLVATGGGADKVSFTGGGYDVTASRSGDDLELTASTGGGFRIPGWFTGENRPSVQAPDGTFWTPELIDSNFSSPVYDVTYSTGVYRIEEALPMLLSYTPSLDGVALAGSYRNDFPFTPVIFQDALANVMYGEEHVDAAGLTYKTFEVPIVDHAFTSGLFISHTIWGLSVSETSGTYQGGAFAETSGSQEWHYWTDPSGQGYIALARASTAVSTGYSWAIPPADEFGEWGMGKHYSGWAAGPSVTSSRQVTLVEPGVDQFVLSAGGLAGAMEATTSLESAPEEFEGQFARVGTGIIAVDELMLPPLDAETSEQVESNPAPTHGSADILQEYVSWLSQQGREVDPAMTWGALVDQLQGDETWLAAYARQTLWVANSLSEAFMTPVNVQPVDSDGQVLVPEFNDVKVTTGYLGDQTFNLQPALAA